MACKKLLILTDDNGYFCISLKSKNRQNSADVKKISQRLEQLGWEVTCLCYNQLDFQKKYTGYYIIYASSEDYGQFYKDYIEDNLLWLEKQGNILLPSIYYFRSHHNKVFMELMRTTFLDSRLQTIYSYFYSSYDDLKRRLQKQSPDYPVVVKAAAGSGSRGVGLAHNDRELLALGKKYSRRIYFDYYANISRIMPAQKLKNALRKQKGIPPVYYRKKSGKFIVQNFIDGLANDYKILIYGDKYYVLKRENRKGDFRASGSGKFEFPRTVDEVENILEFAGLAREQIRQPMISLDIAFDGGAYHLIEFQCVSFGPYTLENSEHYFKKTNGKWTLIEESPELEREIADSIEYIFNHD